MAGDSRAESQAGQTGPRSRWIIYGLAVVIIGAFLLVLAQEVGQNGRSWLGWIDKTAVTTTDYQPLVNPKTIVYPKDFPAQFHLDRLPDSIALRRIDSVAIYRLDDKVVGYSIRGNVAKTDTSQDDLRAAVDVPGYKIDFWMGTDAGKAGDFWIKWNTED